MKEYKRSGINKYFFSRKFKTWKIHFGPLVSAASKCYCGDNGHKTDLLQRTQQHGDCTKPLGNAKFV